MYTWKHLDVTFHIPYMSCSEYFDTGSCGTLLPKGRQGRKPCAARAGAERALLPIGEKSEVES